MPLLECGHDAAQQWWGKCRVCEHNGTCDFIRENGLRCGLDEDHFQHERNLGDPSTGTLAWFVTPNHLYRGPDFGQTNWPEYQRIRFAAAA